MKRSRTVVISLLSATALSLTSCERREELKTCVDRDNVMQDDDKCRDLDQHYPFGGGSYHWAYGGHSNTGSYNSGSTVILDSSPDPEPGMKTATPSEAAAHDGSISNGHVTFHGFGSTGHGGEGEGEGHGGDGGHGSGHGGGAGE
jgi:hypothetical protein